MAETKRITNREYADKADFRERCRKVNCDPSTRQASKYRRGTGRVYKLECGNFNSFVKTRQKSKKNI
jgi:hypothetical protein